MPSEPLAGFPLSSSYWMLKNKSVTFQAPRFLEEISAGQKTHIDRNPSSGQITIIPKPECFGDLGGIPLLFTPIGADQPAGTGRYNLPSLMFSKQYTNTSIFMVKLPTLRKDRGYCEFIPLPHPFSRHLPVKTSFLITFPFHCTDFFLY